MFCKRNTFCDLTAQPIHMLFLNGLVCSFWTQVEMKISSGDVGASEREVQISRVQFKQEDSLILLSCDWAALASCLAPQSEGLKPHRQANEFGNWNFGIILSTQIMKSHSIQSWPQWLQGCTWGSLTQYSWSSSSACTVYYLNLWFISFCVRKYVVRRGTKNVVIAPVHRNLILNHTGHNVILGTNTSAPAGLLYSAHPVN